MTIAHRKAIDVRRAARAAGASRWTTCPNAAARRRRRVRDDDAVAGACARCPTSSGWPWPTTTSPGCRYREVAGISAAPTAAARRAAADGIAALRRAPARTNPSEETPMNDLFDVAVRRRPPWPGLHDRLVARGRARRPARRRLPHRRHPRRHPAAGGDHRRAGAGRLRRRGPRRGAGGAGRPRSARGSCAPRAGWTCRPRARRVLRRHAARAFDLPLDLRLAARVPRAACSTTCREIGYGHTESYAQVAAAAGNPRAVRAVGTACATNPLPVVVPCHRVVRSDGAWGGYVGGPEAKRALLTLEGVGGL